MCLGWPSRKGDHGHHIEPTVIVEITQHDITVISGGQEAIVSRDVGSTGIKTGSVDKNTVLIHEKNVGLEGTHTTTGEGLFANADQIDVPSLSTSPQM